MPSHFVAFHRALTIENVRRGILILEHSLLRMEDTYTRALTFQKSSL
jgi:hypothetical protein